MWRRLPMLGGRDVGEWIGVWRGGGPQWPLSQTKEVELQCTACTWKGGVPQWPLSGIKQRTVMGREDRVGRTETCEGGAPQWPLSQIKAWTREGWRCPCFLPLLLPLPLPISGPSGQVRQKVRGSQSEPLPFPFPFLYPFPFPCPSLCRRLCPYQVYQSLFRGPWAFLHCLGRAWGPGLRHCGELPIGAVLCAVRGDPGAVAPRTEYGSVL